MDPVKEHRLTRYPSIEGDLEELVIITMGQPKRSHVQTNHPVQSIVKALGSHGVNAKIKTVNHKAAEVALKEECTGFQMVREQNMVEILASM